MIGLETGPIGDAESQDDAKGHPSLVGIDFGCAVFAVGEQDGRFTKRGSGTFQVPEDFFLEGISATANGGEVDFLEHRNTVAAERAAAIASSQAEHHSRIEVDAAAHELSLERPVFGSAA